MFRKFRRQLTVINAAVFMAAFLLAAAAINPQTLPAALAGFGIVGGMLTCGVSFFLTGRALAPLRRAIQRQQEYLADAAHELRTPLTVIRTNLDVVCDSPDGTVASQGKWLANIREETVSMARLIDSLLFLARADARRQPLMKRLFPLREAVCQAVAPFEPLAAAKGVSLEVPGRVPPVEFDGDEACIKQLLAILLDNAIRHTPAGGKVSVYLARPGRRIMLTVADTGEGIEPRHQARIFDRFYQVEGKGDRCGAGLGLAIAKWIAENHGGTIDVNSVPGEGSTFTVELPAG